MFVTYENLYIVHSRNDVHLTLSWSPLFGKIEVKEIVSQFLATNYLNMGVVLFLRSGTYCDLHLLTPQKPFLLLSSTLCSDSSTCRHSELVL